MFGCHIGDMVKFYNGDIMIWWNTSYEKNIFFGFSCILIMITEQCGSIF